MSTNQNRNGDSAKDCQARRFLGLLFGQAPPDKFLLMWTLPDKCSTWFPIGHLDEAAEFATSRKGDVYFGVSLSPKPFGPAKRCEADKTAGIVGAWADIDIAGAAHKKKVLPETIEQAIELAGSLGLQPTLSVLTGHGMQLYWLFPSPWIFKSDDDREQARQLVERFQAALRRNAKAAGWDLDSTHDLARVLRVPDTMNCKDQPVPVRLLDSSGPRYDRDAIVAVLEEHGGAFTLKAKAVCSVAERARRYVSRIPGAVEHEEGHKRTFGVAQILVRGFDLSEQDAWPVLLDYNQRCAPPWSEKELRHKLESAAAKSRLPKGYLLSGNGDGASIPPTNGRTTDSDADETHLTDLGNAQRVVVRHGADLRWCHPWKQALVWDGRRWAPDETGEAVRRVKETQQHLFHSTAQALAAVSKSAGDEEGRKKKIDKLSKVLSHALKWEEKRRIVDCLELVKSETGIPILPGQMDRDPFLLNVKNGTIDLRTGQLRPHRRADYITKLAPVDYDPTAGCPLWFRFLDRIMDRNTGLIDYLQRVAGYSLTGDVGEQCLFFLHGSGANGKSTFLGTIKDMLGDYGCQAVGELLMAKNHEAHPTERADLFGRRFVATVEVDEGKRVAEALMKQLTGGDNLKARRMRENFFEVPPTWKIFLAANHKPAIRGTDLAVWRRIKLVPFAVTITDAEKDKGLPAQLRREWPGILSWAVQGCLA